MNMIPKPNSRPEFLDGSFPVKNLISVNHADFDSTCLSAFESRTKTPLARCAEASLTLIRDAAMPKDAYHLLIKPDGITVTASAEAGIILGLTSLYLLRDGAAYPALSLNDAPKYSHRGFMLDCARHFFPVETVKEIIELNALLKLNVFHWHLSDDQGWRIESKAFPKLHQTDGQAFYTQDEIRDIVLFAKLRGVEIIPEIDMPGHTSAALAAYPHLSCHGEDVSLKTRGGIFPIIFCAGKDSTYAFIKALLDEICPLFDSPYFHLGGDEAPKTVWESCPDCKAKLSAIGSDDFEDLQGHFTSVVADMLRGQGKIPVCWNDMLASAAHPDPLQIQQWLSLKNPGSTRTFMDAGHSVVFSDMFFVYFDYPEAFSSLKRVYAYTPAICGEDVSSHPGTLGIQACLWSERVITKQQLFTLIYPRLFAVAEAAWTIERDYADFECRLKPWLAEMAAQNLPFLPLAQCNPTGDARSKQIFETLKAFSAVMSEDTEGTLPITPDTLAPFLRGFDIELPK